MVVLKTSKLFGGLLAVELEALEQTAQLKAYKAGRNIFQEGDPGDGLYLILEGRVQIACLLGQDQRVVLSRLDDGDFCVIFYFQKLSFYNYNMMKKQLAFAAFCALVSCV